LLRLGSERRDKQSNQQYKSRVESVHPNFSVDR
jgi:hypothetical protein